MATRAVGEVPAVGFGTVVGDEADGAGGGEVCNKSVAWGDKIIVNASKPDSAADEGALFHSRVSLGSVLQWGVLDLDSG